MFAVGAARRSLAASGVLVWLIVCLEDVAGIASEEERKACPHYQQMTCFLDVFEKACEEDEAPPYELIKKDATESAWLCCCPLPYKKCTEAERNGVCATAFAKFLEPLGENSKDDAIRDGLQQVRGALREAGGEPCKVLGEQEPLTTCGKKASPPVQRSLARADLFCEMLTWQREELGDGNQQEFESNGCPWPARQGNDPERKGVGWGNMEEGDEEIPEGEELEDDEAVPGGAEL
mmetsp:Transcript_36349/g.73269  ORF Transcript_36349/g.73269 Transcript_36349/m.73269 type:complete len:235 (-) Transcript_36349:935-1639(-)